MGKHSAALIAVVYLSGGLGSPALFALLPPVVVVHRETYDDSALPAALDAYDALRPRQKPRYPEVHGPAPEGCTWSENAARQLAVPERFGFRAWLRLRGFALD